MKAKQLRPDVVVIDLQLCEKSENVQWNSIFGDPKLFVVSFGIDEETKAPVARNKQIHSVGSFS